ncbi:MAG: hypothetical protein K8S55_07410 [Phycisphaerae bacterium]|nr:hypothetical protein [Phycisphaerae bacterium]
MKSTKSDNQPDKDSLHIGATMLPAVLKAWQKAHHRQTKSQKNQVSTPGFIFDLSAFDR